MNVEEGRAFYGLPSGPGPADRIAALEAEVAGLRGERDAARSLSAVYVSERDAALAQVAGLRRVIEAAFTLCPTCAPKWVKTGADCGPCDFCRPLRAALSPRPQPEGEGQRS